MLNYWKRLTNLPDRSLAKKALLENANMRTNWILTIEKLVRLFGLIEVPGKKFKEKTKTVIPLYFIENWKRKLLNEDISRLNTYKTLNDNFSIPKHLGLPYQSRKIISRTRCSNHPLAIEKGRHKNPIIPREERLCELCYTMEIEEEDHFLLRCTSYSYIRDHYQMNQQTVPEMLNMEDQNHLAQFLSSAFELRQNLLWGREKE